MKKHLKALVCCLLIMVVFAIFMYIITKYPQQIGLTIFCLGILGTLCVLYWTIYTNL